MRGIRFDGGEQVAVGGDAREYLVEAQLAQLGRVELGPGARRGDGRLRTPAERVGGDGGLGGVVLTPVDEHPARAYRFRHRADDEVGVIGLESARQLAGERRDLLRRARAVEARIEMDAFRPARHGQGLHAHAVQDLARPPGDLGAFGQPRAGTGVEIEHEPIGLSSTALRTGGRFEPPLRGVQLEARHL
ncbi:MAG: hypothetical protein R2692_07990, partial [Microbacterium sp.]